MAKKFLFTLFIGITSWFSATAQKDTLLYYMRVVRVSETRAYEIAIPIKDKDSADFFRAILPPDSSVDKDLFIVRDYYKNGKPKMIGTSTNREYYPHLTGQAIEFYPNGKRKFVKNYDKDTNSVDEIQYFPNGKAYLHENHYKDGKDVINECLDSLGKVLAENGNGNCVIYDPDFKRVYAEGKLVDGVKDGEWKGSLEDSAKYVCTYEKGALKKGIGYDKRGTAYPFGTFEFADPVFKGGLDKFLNFISKNLKYPAVAKENNVQGKVFITFTVNKDGNLSDFRIVRGIGSGCDEEVLRVIKQSPPWIPGTQFGIPVRQAFTLPISFTLEYKEERGKPM